MKSVNLENAKPPIFIIGNPRSGTTMLRLMLTCHPDIGIPPESGWFIHLYQKYHQTIFDQVAMTEFLNNLSHSPKIEGWELDYSQLQQFLAKNLPLNYCDLISQIYYFYINTQDKCRWGDKNNFYLKHIKTIYKLFPNAYFIHIIRDGRDVACSYRNLSQAQGQYAPDLPASVCGAAYDWVRNIRKIQDSFQQINHNQTITIHYEDLTQDAEKTLQKICTFIGETYDSKMLDFAEENKQKQLEPKVFMGWKELTSKPLTTSRVKRWKREMFEEDKYLFQIFGKTALQHYGYELANINLRVPQKTILWCYGLSWFIVWLFQKTGQKLRFNKG